MSSLYIQGLINSLRAYYEAETLRLEVFTSNIDTRYQILLMIDELNNIIAGRGVPISYELRDYISRFPGAADAVDLAIADAAADAVDLAIADAATDAVNLAIANAAA